MGETGIRGNGELVDRGECKLVKRESNCAGMLYLLTQHLRSGFLRSSVSPFLRIPVSPFLRFSLAAMLFVFAAAPIAHAQNTIKGRVVDENGAAVPNIQVLLHRVTAQSGGSVDRDTSDAQGAFTLEAPAEQDSSALFFVAVEEGGELFMGEMQRLPFPDTLEYIVEAGDDPVQLPPPVQPEERRAGYYVILAGVLLVASVLFFVLRRRPPADRRILTQLATLPEDDQSEATARRRRALYARLKRSD